MHLQIYIFLTEQPIKVNNSPLNLKINKDQAKNDWGGYITYFHSYW